MDCPECGLGPMESDYSCTPCRTAYAELHYTLGLPDAVAQSLAPYMVRMAQCATEEECKDVLVSYVITEGKK